jgi:hypothetical protein
MRSMKGMIDRVRARMNEGRERFENQMMHLVLVSGAVFIAVGLGEFFYIIVHRVLPPYELKFFPLWHVALFLILTLVLATQSHNPRLRIAALAFAVSQGVELWKLIWGSGPTLSFIDHAWCVVMGAIFFAVAWTRTGQKAHAISLLLCVDVLVFKYFATANWVHTLETYGARGGY